MPTGEFTLTEKEERERLRRMSDPRQRLSVHDLVIVKARPLTTKRTFALAPCLMDVINEYSPSAASDEDHACVVQMAVLCCEELVRIVSAGGSAVAEVERLTMGKQREAARLIHQTDTRLYKLFGNKAKVQIVHSIVERLLELLDQWTTPGPDRLTINATLAYLMGSAASAIATVAVSMGPSFMVPHNMQCMRVMAQLCGLSTKATCLLPERARALLCHASLRSIRRVLPSSWSMCFPYLPSIIASCVSQVSLLHAEGTEVLSLLESLLEHRIVLEGISSALLRSEEDVRGTWDSVISRILTPLFRSSGASSDFCNR
jgi:hypothetical protein